MILVVAPLVGCDGGARERRLATLDAFESWILARDGNAALVVHMWKRRFLWSPDRRWILQELADCEALAVLALRGWRTATDVHFARIAAESALIPTFIYSHVGRGDFSQLGAPVAAYA